MNGPYRAEFGAIHHEAARGFLFTVSPPEHAETVAEALNRSEALRDLKTESIKVSPGDLLVVFCDADTRAEFEALRRALESVSHALNVRVLALPTTARLERVEGGRLFQLGFRIHDRASDFGPLDAYGPRNPVEERERFSRMVAETAGELGLVILKPESVKP